MRSLKKPPNSAPKDRPEKPLRGINPQRLEINDVRLSNPERRRKLDLDFETSLNDRQREAVYETDGPMLILAGAGSGKTRVLTYKIARIAQTGAALPHEILAVTFTNKAAKEMRDRIDSMMPGLRFPYINTFHSFCAKVLRGGAPAGYRDNFAIYDESEKLSIIKDSLRELGIDQDKYPPSKISSLISRMKNKMKGPDDLKGPNPEWETLARVYSSYSDRMMANNAMDFDDLLTNAWREFRDGSPYADRIRKQIKYVLIDEYQDINMIQYMLVREICRENRNITVVGDDDQSIYRFRGADMSIILRFEEDYPDARTIKLEQNYRSTSCILDAANALMLHNKKRKPKRLWTDTGKGEKLRLTVMTDGGSEARFIASKIRELTKTGGYSYKDFAVIYRTNAQSRPFEEACMQEGIPYRLVGANDFYKRAEIKDVTAYLKIIGNRDDDVSFRRIVNTPPRGIGDVAVSRIEERAERLNKSLFEAARDLSEPGELPAKQAAAMKDLIETIESAAEKAESGTVFDALEHIVERTAFRDYLMRPSKRTDGDGSTARGAERVENLDEFLTVAREAEHTSLQEFLSYLALASDADAEDSDDGKVHLMTFHLVKGLEFPVVFLVGLEEGLIPHFMSMDDEESLEEERRLLYVGITRAEKLLFLTYAIERMQRGQFQTQTPSRFIREIPAAYLERSAQPRGVPRRAFAEISRRRAASSDRRLFSATGESISRPAEAIVKGDVVRHSLFGRGMVLKCQGDAIEVDFLKKGKKTVMRAFLAKEQ